MLRSLIKIIPRIIHWSLKNSICLSSLHFMTAAIENPEQRLYECSLTYLNFLPKKKKSHKENIPTIIIPCANLTNSESAISNLNSLQSNAQTIAKIRRSRKQMSELNVQESLNLLKILNISLDNIDRLNCIHVTGTKGKGSTSAFVESILRKLGYKTGFYSSPHLVHVRERIRINGKPVSKKTFSENFFHVFDELKIKLSPSGAPMPTYFKFLTLLAFRIFCEECVDVAIIEVGIGGEHDCTNVIRRPIICAITSLDIDHVNILGHTLREIAWHKAGIAKPGSLLLTVQQPPEAMQVIRERCVEKQSRFHIVPNILEYSWPKCNVIFGIPGKHQAPNVSLALELVRFWMREKFGNSIEDYPENGVFVDSNTPKELLRAFKVTPKIMEALEECRWPGRSQTIHRGNITFFLDGAHTPQSMQYCAEWFQQAISQDVLPATENSQCMRVLIFHCTGDRDPMVLLSKLKPCEFTTALFTPTRLHPVQDTRNDNTNLNLDLEVESRKCARDKDLWIQLTENDNAQVLDCVESALNAVQKLAENNSGVQIQVLVTGSLHLVGGILGFVDPGSTE